MADETLKTLAIQIAIESGSFQAGMKDLKNQMSVIDTSFKASTAGMKDWGKNLDGLQANSAALTEKISVQERIVQSYRDQLQKAEQALSGNAQKMMDLKEHIASVNAVYEQSKATLGANDEYTKKLKEDLDKLTGQYQAAERTVLSNNNSIQGYTIQLNNAQGALRGLESELAQNDGKIKDFGKAAENAGNDVKKAEDKSNNWRESLGKLGSGLQSIASGALKVAAGAIAAVAAATGAAIAGAVELGKATLENADETQTLAETYGMTAEQIQVMRYQGTKLDVDLDVMTKSQSKLTKTMGTAQDQLAKYNEGLKEHEKNHKKAVPELGNVAAAFKTLGVNAIDPVTNQLRDSKTVMQEAITALGKMTNETQRDELAMTLFGKSAMELNPLIKAGGDELARLSDEAYKTGAVLSNTQNQGLDAFKDSMDALKLSVTGVAGQLLSTLQPQMDSVMNMFKGLAQAGAEAVKTGDWSNFKTQVGTVIQSLAEMATRAIPVLIQVGTTILTTLISTIVTSIPTVLPQLVQGVLQLVNAIVGLLSSQGPTLVTTAINAVSTLVTGLMQALPQLLQAAVQIVLALVNGIAEQLPTLIPAAVNCILTLAQTLINNLPMLIDAAIKLILALVNGIIKSIPIILEAAPRIVTSLVNGIVQAIPKLLDAALQIILALIKFIPVYIPMLIRAVPQIVTAIVTGLISAVGEIWKFVPKMFTELWNALKSIEWGKLGRNVIDGIVSGITSAASAIWNAVKKAVQGALDSVKSFLGIHSPSTVMRDQVGANLVKGMAEGITGNSGLVSGAMAGLKSMLSAGSMDIALNPKVAIAGTAAGGSMNTFSPSESGAGGSMNTFSPSESGAGGPPITINYYGSIRSDQDVKDMATLLQRDIITRQRGLGLVNP